MGSITVLHFTSLGRVVDEVFSRRHTRSRGGGLDPNLLWFVRH